MTSMMLVCAVLMSLAVGVLVAYAICVTMFHIFRMHSEQIQSRRALSQAAAVVQS